MAALARGARINRDLINKKLQCHSLPYLQGSHIDGGDNDDVNKLLHILGLDTKARVCAMFPYDPYGRPIDAADYLIIGYEWNFVLHAKEVEEALPKKEIPTGFEIAVRLIDPEARHGVWCVAGVGEEGLSWSEVAESVSRNALFLRAHPSTFFAGL